MTRGVRQELRRGLWTAGFRGPHQRMLNRMLGGRQDSRRWCQRGKPIMDSIFLEIAKLAFNRWTAQGEPPLDQNFLGERFLRNILRDCMKSLRDLREGEEMALHRGEGDPRPAPRRVPRRRPVPRPVPQPAAGPSEQAGHVAAVQAETVEPDIIMVEGPLTRPTVSPLVKIEVKPEVVVISSDSDVQSG